MTKKTIIKMEERVNFELLKNKIKSLNRSDEFENSLYEKLETIRTKVKKGTIRVTYDYVKVIGENVYGRLYPVTKDDACYCKMESSIRSYFAKEFYKYIDLTCCHANILKDLANHYEIDSKWITNYCENRESIIQKHNTSKKTINEQCNYETLYVKDELTTGIFNMIYSKNGLVSRLANDAYFAPLFKKLKDEESQYTDTTRPFNLRGKFISLVCQTYECFIIKKAINFLSERDIFPNSYIYDGLLIKKEKQFDLETLNEYICAEYNGVKMTPKFKFEEFLISDQYKEIFDRDCDSDSVTSNEEDLGRLTDDEVADYILRENEGKIINNKGTLYAYDKNTWTTDVPYVVEIMISKCELNVCPNPKEAPSLVKSRTKNWEHYKKQILNKCRSDLPVVDILDRTLCQLGFLNGVYNFTTREFKTYEEYGVYYSTMCVKKNFPINRTKMGFVRDFLLDIFNGDEVMLDSVLSFISRSMAGHVSDKNALLMLGDRCSGKGVIILMIETAFFGVVGVLDTGSLTNGKTFEASDRKNAFLSPVCSNLLCTSQEIDPKPKIDGTLWRKMVSGGDEVSFRTAYGRPQVEKIRASCIFTANVHLSFDQKNSSSTLLTCNFPCQYVDEPDNTIFTGVVQKKADNNVKYTVSSPDFIEAFTLLVLESYKSEKPSYKELREATMEISEVENETDDGTQLIKSIRSNFIITQDKEDILYISDVHKLISERPNKIRSVLESMGVKERKGRNKREYVGIKKRPKEDQDSLF